jgi:aspartate/glutamate racemase
MNIVAGGTYDIFNWYLKGSTLYGDVLISSNIREAEYISDKERHIGHAAIAKKDEKHRNKNPHTVYKRQFEAIEERVIDAGCSDVVHTCTGVELVLRNMDGFFDNTAVRCKRQKRLLASLPNPCRS